MYRRAPIAVLTLVWYLLLIPLALPLAPPPATPHLPATTLQTLPPEVAALGFLASSPRCYSAQVGIGGSVPPQVYAWNTLLQMPRADTLFATLVRIGTLPGQLYGLAGLYYADSVTFKAAATQVASQHALVEVMRGCSSFSWDVAQLVEEIRSGYWSLELATARQAPVLSSN